MEVGKIFRLHGTQQRISSAGSAGFPSFVVPTIDSGSIAAAFRPAEDLALSGYNRTRPGQSEADLLVATKELISDGLPSIPLLGAKGSRVPLARVPDTLQDALKWFRDLGSEYLNGVFGWKPFVQDLRKLYGLLKDLDNQVNRLVSQNGHTIRRRAMLVDSETRSQDVTVYNGTAYANVYGGSGIPNGQPGCASYWTRDVVDTTQAWYSACYRYWIPNPASWQWQAKAKAVLFGGYPTPANLYAAMPWSWLADWAASLGDILKAMSPTAVDNLVMLHGYTMHHSTHKVQCATTVMYPPNNSEAFFPGIGYLGARYTGLDASCSSTYVDEKKVRTGGWNPFGPDKVAAGFSPYQLSILSALGLTRSG